MYICVCVCIYTTKYIYKKHKHACTHSHTVYFKKKEKITLKCTSSTTVLKTWKQDKEMEGLDHNFITVLSRIPSTSITSAFNKHRQKSRT